MCSAGEPAATLGAHGPALRQGGRAGLGGLPQRLVQDGVVDESGMHAAISAASIKKTSFVTQLIAAGAASARDIAITASSEYGVPICASSLATTRSAHSA